MSIQLKPARRVRGEITVPGAIETAERELLLACLSAGQSRLSNSPLGLCSLFEELRPLGIKIGRPNGGLIVTGRKVGALDPGVGEIDLTAVSAALPIALAILGGQGFVSRVRVGAHMPVAREFLLRVEAMGISWKSISDELLELGGTKLHGCALVADDLEAEGKMGLMVAALHASGTTCFEEVARKRDFAVRTLRSRGVDIARQKTDGGSSSRVSICGGQKVQSGAVELAGDLQLTSPFLALALSLSRSELAVRNVEVCSGTRPFFDLMRQLGGQVELVHDGDGRHRLEARSTNLKATRIAGKRVEKLLDQLPLVAVVATQANGEFLIRDIAHLRCGPLDRVAHLVEQLRAMDAKIGEFPEGIVIKGGSLLRGARIDCAGDPAFAQAFAIAGLLAEEDTELEAAESLEDVIPKFFETLESITKEKK